MHVRPEGQQLAPVLLLRDTGRIWIHSEVPRAVTEENILQVCTHFAM